MRNIKLNEIQYVLDKMKEHFQHQTLDVESINLDDSYNRYISDDIVSHMVIPAYRKSTVDGYAMKITTSPLKRKLIQSNHILTMDQVLCEDKCIYVPTGGRVPSDADLVVKIEETVLENDSVVFRAYEKCENIIEVGSDMNKGDLLYTKGHHLTSFDIGVLALLGYETVKVFKKPSLAIISTGDELVSVKSDLVTGQTRDVNSHTLKALSSSMGLDVTYSALINDDRSKLKTAILEGHKNADITIVSGGSSMGVKDYTFDLLDEIGEVISDGMALKPGKPTIVSSYLGKPILGLPGHPVSAIMVFKIIMRSLLTCYGMTLDKDSSLKAIITRDVKPARGRDTYQMLHFTLEDDNVYAHPTTGKSGMMTLLTQSEGYTIIDKKDVIRKGDLITCYMFK